jgi:crotonobetainyl-CoA:carnitine CoA-transferase CaiB-like acyl-CoA transferase
MVNTPGALDGVRVLDLADESGALCGKLLADMGADVIKVEPPGGARMRGIGPFYGGDADASMFFWHDNTNKRSVTLDLDADDDRERFVRLARTADIIIETAAPGSLEAMGLGYGTLGASNPRLTLVSITPFGQTGPYRNYRGSDLIGQATGGMVFVNGFPGEAPLPGFGPQAYHSASTYGAIGALLALLARERTGRGQWIDVSIQECVAAAVEHASSFFLQNGTTAERQGSLHWTRYFRVGKCRDGYVMHCTLGDWTSLIEWVKADGKAQDLAEPAWNDFNHRRDHCQHLFDVLDEWATAFSVAELVDGAQLRRIPYAPVLPPETLPENPQLKDRGFFVPVHHPELGATLTYPGAPYVFSRTPWRIRRRPPLLGEHNEEVLAEVEQSLLPDPPPFAEVLTGEGNKKPTTHHSTLTTQHSPLNTHRALAGVRIIDFTWVVAGPVATRILADHGAEVIKIERRDALDFGSRRAGLTGNLNRSKQSIVLNMSTPRGVELAQQLIATADVVIDNFSARVMRNWGLDHEHLRRIKPDIIAVSMSGFGSTGPWQDYVSYGPTLQALAGYTLSMRHPGREPAGWGFSYSDMAGGSSGALAVLIALWHRRRTGEGQCVDLSQFENLVTLLGPDLLQILVSRALEPPCAAPPSAGPLETPSAGPPAAAPALETPRAAVYRCADLPGAGPARDRWCTIAVGDDDEWNRFCAVIDHPPWTRDQRFSTRRGRSANQRALDALVESWTRRRTAEDVMTRLQRAGVAAGVVANAEDLCRRDPHLQARGYWARVTTPEGDSVECDGVPFKMSATPGHIDAAGPLLGEHTNAVLQRVLNLSPEAIAALRSNRIVA